MDGPIGDDGLPAECEHGEIAGACWACDFNAGQKHLGAGYRSGRAWKALARKHREMSNRRSRIIAEQCRLSVKDRTAITARDSEIARLRGALEKFKARAIGLDPFTLEEIDSALSPSPAAAVREQARERVVEAADRLEQYAADRNDDEPSAWCGPAEALFEAVRQYRALPVTEPTK